MRWVLCFLITVFHFTATASAQERLAFVVGIDAYAHIADLKKAGNDARAVSAKLSKLNFEVTELVDPTRYELRREMTAFIRKIGAGDEVVFYFAGHGLQVNGRNYLLPSDVPKVVPGDEEFVIGESVDPDLVLNLIQARNARVALMILDACRDNPFPTEGTRSVGGGGGLSQMEPTEGSFVLFSAGAGQKALDRLSNDEDNPNSVFTRALLSHMDTPGLPLHALARLVRADVRKMAATVNHRQFPAYFDQLQGDFVFEAESPSPRQQTVTPGPVLSKPSSARPNPCEAARADWDLVQDTQSKTVLKAFMSTHSNCPIYTAAADARLQNLAPSQKLSPGQPALSTCEQLWYARNLIFHNNGYCFETARARAVFDTNQCMTRTPRLSSAEEREVQRLRAAEKVNGC